VGNEVEGAHEGSAGAIVRCHFLVAPYAEDRPADDLYCLSCSRPVIVYLCFLLRHGVSSSRTREKRLEIIIVHFWITRSTIFYEAEQDVESLVLWIIIEKFPDLVHICSSLSPSVESSISGITLARGLFLIEYRNRVDPVFIWTINFGDVRG
jgi:hypothetical protein